MNTLEPIHLLKIAVMGDTQVGKTSILNRLVDDQFKEEIPYTIGVDFKIKMLTLDRQVKLYIWDTAGRERFRAIQRSYCRGVHIFVLVFDITNRNTLDRLIRDYKDYSMDQQKETSLCMIVGNKTDLNEQRQISQDEGQQLAKDMNCLYTEVSCKDNNTGILEIFEVLVRKAIEHLELMGEITRNIINKPDCIYLRNPAPPRRYNCY